MLAQASAAAGRAPALEMTVSRTRPSMLASPASAGAGSGGGGDAIGAAEPSNAVGDSGREVLRWRNGEEADGPTVPEHVVLGAAVGPTVVK